MTKALPVLLGCVALAAAATSFATGAWADDDDHEVTYEAEDLEDVLEATEALVADLVSPAAALQAVAAKSEGAPLEVSLGSAEIDGKRVAAWEVEMISGTSLVEWVNCIQ